MKRLILLFIVFLTFVASAISPNLQSRLFLRGLKSEGFAWVFYDQAKEKTYIHYEDLEGFLDQYLKSDYLLQIKKLIPENGYITPEQLATIGLKAQFNLNTLDISISAPSDKYIAQRIHLTGAIRTKDELDDFIKPGNFSTYLNLKSFYQFRSSDDSSSLDDNRNLNDLEWVANFKGFTLENQLLLNSNPIHSNEFKSQRTLSRLTYDFKSPKIRARAGDLNYIPFGFQEYRNIFGFGLNKEYTIDPNYSRFIYKNHQVIVDKPSTIEIYVNNKLIGKRRVLAGPVSIRDFPFISGENEVLIKIIDLNNNLVSEKLISLVQDSDLLPKGSNDFGAHLGYITDPQTQDRAPETDLPFFSGYYRWGHGHRSLLGANLQYSKNYSLLGLEGIFVHRNWGSWKSHLALNQQEPEGVESSSGVALRLENQSLLNKNGLRQSYFYRLQMEYASRDFYSQNSVETNSTPLLFSNRGHQYFVDFSLHDNNPSEFRTALGVRYSKGYEKVNTSTTYYGNVGWRAKRSLLFEMRFQNRIFFRGNEDREVSPGLVINLTWYDTDGGQQVLSSYDPIRESYSLFHQKQDNWGHESYNINSFATSNGNTKSFNIDGNYAQQRYQLFASHTYSENERSFINSASTKNKTKETQIGLGIGLAYTQGTFAISRPISESFAIVKTSKDLNQPVYFNKYTNYSKAVIDKLGPAVINNLASYQRRHINIDMRNLPLGISVKSERQTLRPGYKTGTLIEYEIEGRLAITGKVFNFGQPYSLQVGSMIQVNQDLSRTEHSRFFTNKDGKFIIENLSPGVYFIEFDSTQVKPFKVEVNDEVGLKDIGLLKLRTGSDE